MSQILVGDRVRCRGTLGVGTVTAKRDLGVIGADFIVQWDFYVDKYLYHEYEIELAPDEATVVDTDEWADEFEVEL